MGQQIFVPVAAHGSDSKLSGNTNGNSRSAFLDKHCNYSRLETFKFVDLKRATRNFSQDMHLGNGGSAKMFLGWIDNITLAPSTCDNGNCVAVKRFNKGRLHVEQSKVSISKLMQINLYQ